MKFLVFLKIVTFGYVIIYTANAQTEAPKLSICGPETELRLKGSGPGSSIILSLAPDGGHPGPGTCKVRVTAPDKHIVHVHIAEREEEEEIQTVADRRSGRTSCILSVYLPENRRTAIWRTDPCSQDILPEGQLLTHQLRLVWNTPVNKTHARGRRLTLTALGQGESCLSEKMHICDRVGWNPRTCVAEELLCDGIPHCPIGSATSDESQQLCQERKVLTHSTWEKIAAEFIKKFTGKSKPGSMIPTISTEEANWFLGKDIRTTTEKINRGTKNRVKIGDSPSPNIDSLSSALTHYGPWGYLMLGMLICGTVLMLCGLWECCCRQNKPSGEQNIRGSHSQPTTVLIINPQSGPGSEDNQGPPNYEDLDQPPSYSALFPRKITTGFVRQQETA